MRWIDTIISNADYAAEAAHYKFYGIFDRDIVEEDFRTHLRNFEINDANEDDIQEFVDKIMDALSA